jgi:hypothetical protein
VHDGIRAFAPIHVPIERKWKIGGIDRGLRSNDGVRTVHAFRQAEPDLPLLGLLRSGSHTQRARGNGNGSGLCHKPTGFLDRLRVRELASDTPSSAPLRFGTTDLGVPHRAHFANCRFSLLSFRYAPRSSTEREGLVCGKECEMKWPTKPGLPRRTLVMPRVRLPDTRDCPPSRAGRLATACLGFHVANARVGDVETPRIPAQTTT